MNEPKPGDDPDIADASFLFQDETRPTHPPKSSGGSSPPIGSREDYEIEEVEPVANPSLRRASILPDESASSPRQRAQAAESHVLGTDVSLNWSRGAEWGGDALRLVICCVIYLFVGYISFSVDHLGGWLLILFVGLLLLLVPAYPILITLERPVRVTPEQAIRDYHDSLNHLFPHHRRMWLLLSDQGKAEFSDFSEFKAYWVKAVADWKKKSGKTGVSNPVTVTVENFKTGGKSAGLARIEADYSLRVVTRVDDRPVFLCAVTKAALVKGTDRMWYLTSGKLPEC